MSWQSDSSRCTTRVSNENQQYQLQPTDVTSATIDKAVSFERDNTSGVAFGMKFETSVYVSDIFSLQINWINNQTSARVKISVSATCEAILKSIGSQCNFSPTTSLEHVIRCPPLLRYTASISSAKGLHRMLHANC